MTWEEKINLMKSWYSEDDFSVPGKYRKSLLRKIEVKFIARKDYHELNSPKYRYSNWWSNIRTSLDDSVEINSESLSSFIDPNDSYWLACEFSSSVIIYKAKKNAILTLIQMGRTWCDTFHLIQLKIDYLMGFTIEDDGSH